MTYTTRCSAMTFSLLNFLLSFEEAQRLVQFQPTVPYEQRVVYAIWYMIMMVFALRKLQRKSRVLYALSRAWCEHNKTRTVAELFQVDKRPSADEEFQAFVNYYLRLPDAI